MRPLLRPDADRRGEDTSRPLSDRGPDEDTWATRRKDATSANRGVSQRIQIRPELRMNQAGCERVPSENSSVRSRSTRYDEIRHSPSSLTYSSW